MAIKIKIDISGATAALNQVKRQIPFATAQAINDVAFQVQRAEHANLLATFKNPRPFSANSVLVDKATKSNPTALVYVRPEVAKYLQPYETGGEHVLPGRALLEPIGAKVDAYGQLPKGAVQRLVARPDVFVGKVDNVMGVWQRKPVTKAARGRARRLGQAVKHHVRLLIEFGNNRPVNKRLGFHEIAMTVVRTSFTAAFNSALAKAISTAKK